MQKITKPFLKWVGGKIQILPEIMSCIPREIENYHEIFLGGGSVLFSILAHKNTGKLIISGKIYAYDINPQLIWTYQCIQQFPAELYEILQILAQDFKTCANETLNRNPANYQEAKKSKENFYYWIRTLYNSTSNFLFNFINPSVDNQKISIYEEIISKKYSQTRGFLLCSAMFIFLNKTCFRGLYRVSAKGFNVPFGNYSEPEFLNEEHLYEIHNLIQCVDFRIGDFSVSLLNTKKNDLIYIDPLYVPENINSFTKYSINDFSTDSHTKLFNMIHNLTLENKKIILSNSRTKFII